MEKRKRIAAVTLVTAVLGVGAVVAYNPYLLVRAQFERQRVIAGLADAEVVVAGHRWVYAYSDDAPPGAPIVVMLHGFTGSKENWYPVAERLRGKYRLLVPDLPGWGESERQPDADYGFVAQGARVAAFIQALSPDQPVVLLGHSMGGGIAALVAARHPQLVDRLGLLDAAGVRFKDNQFGADVLAGANPFAVGDRASLQRYIDTVFHRAESKPWIPWPASSGLISKRRNDAAFEQAVLEHIGRGPERFLPGEAAAGIRQPTLLLWGRQDAVIDPSALDLYAARMPQARKMLVDDAGHMALMEQPDAVAAAVIALIEQGRPR
ncbi:alpha/beta hydrolase [Lysobacter sp. CFH 32150]|uniref:alpha/beta fold hydrolase n=1 Tax=Lysobacter sp. CFH 32150 TaxID=2927128 RepID=UPI001FA782C2|nr:alpha/beta hydrolase [Lysobacter sp. CFH 32150]MCI4568188.1 alpha/beta hydrolase [Lysobacter sp. CFH 32150]